MATVSSRQSPFSSSTNFFNDLLDSNNNTFIHQKKETNDQEEFCATRSLDPSIRKRPGTPKHTTFESALKKQPFVLSPEEKKRYSQLYNIDDENILQEIIIKRNKHNSSLIGLDQNSVNSKIYGHSNQNSYNNHIQNSNNSFIQNNGGSIQNEQFCINTPQHSSYHNHSKPTQGSSLMSTPALQLKTPTSNIQTVTVLSPTKQNNNNDNNNNDNNNDNNDSNDNNHNKPKEVDPTEKMNQYFQDFSKFHQEQEINHKKRMSGKIDIHGNQKQNQKQNQILSSNNTKKSKFHLHSFINKLRSVSGTSSKNDNGKQKNKSKMKKQFYSNSINRQKSKSFRGKNNTILSKNSSPSPKQPYWNSSPNFQDPQSLSAIIDFCQIPLSRISSNNSMTEKIYQTVNNIRAAQRHHIKPRYSLRYNKHYKLKNYSSISDLHIDLSDFANSTKNAPFTYHPKRKKTQKKNKTGTHTQTKKDKLQNLWNEYLTQVVFQRVQLRLQMEKEYNTSSSMETTSGSGEEVKQHSQDLTHLDMNNMPLFDMKRLRKYTSTVNSTTHNESSESEEAVHNNHNKSSSCITNEDLYSIQNIINEYIEQKRKSISATTSHKSNQSHSDHFSKHSKQASNDESIRKNTSTSGIYNTTSYNTTNHTISNMYSGMLDTTHQTTFIRKHDRKDAQ
ncbi:hypothetical protein AWRI3579_g783 [Hanseniaspora osmophila]|uniref:Uncharacterized protein n=1 Tax=Hanseniaspora osmophila TaxID=56408 RepID=A0A1E5RNM7_9ASCO|nr:hypothetical protein AWRI3579_g783 [Hanseniaspora osmophila]